MNPLGRLPYRRIRVVGPSMVPTLRHGDVVLARRSRQPRTGDVVVVTWVTRPGQLSIKRATRATGGRWHVEGDNAIASTDSRELGPADVHGVVLARLWPHPRLLSSR
ncbi:S26 family signal peptidase [Actinophytocola oryzae]|uniref:Peptidase S24-like protein n=1 Tax=Actinophytocola oryzae TaxID=502181 RepID=A0A4R7VRL3_9PSEU|nr:S26 family signal peptidase [Actinophytocola oryzae]TDV52453.1 peptidase S24-like protein [Actinophytocola oryzae]